MNWNILMKMISVAFAAILFSCQADKTHGLQSKANLGPFMGMAPTDKPKLLAPNLIGSPLDEYNGTFSPDGREFYYTTNAPGLAIISYSEMDENGNWSKPQAVPFSSPSSEYDPLFSPDGDRLYFSSERKASPSEEAGKTNIWYIERHDSVWSAPEMLWLDSNSTYYSSLTRNGTIYFNIWDNGDMYKAVPSEDGYEVMALDTILNSSNGEGDPFISPDEDYLIYRGYNNSLGRGDLYISFNIDGAWTAPENLGEPINSSAHEMCPYVTVDGKFFIFASGRFKEPFSSLPNKDLNVIYDKFQSPDNGQLNIYYMSADFIGEMRAKYD